MPGLRAAHRLDCRTLTLIVGLVGLAIPAQAMDDSVSFSTTIDEFRRLAPDQQISLLKRAFERRLRLGENLYYEAMQRGHVSKSIDGKVGERKGNLNGRRYRHWRRGDSYRIDSEKGGADVLKPNEFAESSFDSRTGLVTKTSRFSESPRMFGRIDRDQSYDIRENRYAYWLDGKPDSQTNADFLIRQLVDQSDHYEIEVLAGRPEVGLTIPWIPPWSKTPLGTRTFLLDPVKGFLPIQGRAHLEQPRPNGKLIWRDEEFFVGASQLVGDVWMPTKLKEQIRASPTGPDHVAIWETEVTLIKAGSVTEEDLIVHLLEGTEVVNVIEGSAYVVGRGATRLRERPLSFK
jgi:hypothetical protein